MRESKNSDMTNQSNVDKSHRMWTRQKYKVLIRAPTKPTPIPTPIPTPTTTTISTKKSVEQTTALFAIPATCSECQSAWVALKPVQLAGTNTTNTYRHIYPSNCLILDHLNIHIPTLRHIHLGC